MGILQVSEFILCIIPLPPLHTSYYQKPPTCAPTSLQLSSIIIVNQSITAHPILPRPRVLQSLRSILFNDSPQPLTSLLNALTTIIYTTYLAPYYQCPPPSILDLGCNDMYLDKSIDDDASLEAVCLAIINLVWRFIVTVIAFKTQLPYWHI